MVAMLGFWALLVYIGIPLTVILLLIWIYKIKRNSDIQVQQNEEIIKLLEKRENQQM